MLDEKIFERLERYGITKSEFEQFIEASKYKDILQKNFEVAMRYFLQTKSLSLSEILETSLISEIKQNEQITLNVLVAEDLGTYSYKVCKECWRKVEDAVDEGGFFVCNSEKCKGAERTAVIKRMHQYLVGDESGCITISIYDDKVKDDLVGRMIKITGTMKAKAFFVKTYKIINGTPASQTSISEHNNVDEQKQEVQAEKVVESDAQKEAALIEKVRKYFTLFEEPIRKEHFEKWFERYGLSYNLDDIMKKASIRRVKGEEIGKDVGVEFYIMEGVTHVSKV